MIPDSLTIREREDWLLDRGFNPKSIANRWITSNTYAPIEIMEVCYNYITHELGLDTKVFKKNPFVFHLSIEDNLKPKVEYITQELGLDAKVFEKNPQLFNLSIENTLKPKVKYIAQELGLDISIFEMLPQLFNLDIENNIKLKYLYLTSEIGISNIDLERFPTAFSYSLKKRIIPRLEFAKSRNKTNLSLSSLLAPNDIVFANKMETDIAHYDVFKSENEAFIKEIYDSLTKAAART